MTLRSRLVLAMGVILAVVVTGAVFVQHTQQQYLVGQLDEQLRATRPFFRPLPGGAETPVQQPVGAPGVRPDQPVSNLYVGLVDDGEVSTILRGQLLGDTPDLSGVDLPSAAERSASFTVPGTSGTSSFRVLAVESGSGQNVAVVALPLDEVRRSIDRLRWGLAGGAAAIVAALLLALWWVERLSLRPVSRVTAVADAITSGDRSRRVTDTDPRTEAGRLATAFNVMLDERDASEERLRRFVSDASHELRTPLTSIRGYLDFYAEGGFRGPGQLEDAVRRMTRESARMQSLVEDLLLLSKLDESPQLRHDAVDLAELLRDAASDARVLQPTRRITVDATAPVLVHGDEVRLEQVVGILLSNALTHTDATTPVALSVTTDGAVAEVRVSDAGPGLSAEDAARVFDRFYRGDPSRTRATGGSGLGLAIAKSIVEAQCGTIELSTAPGAGATFIVRIPVAAPRVDPAR